MITCSSSVSQSAAAVHANLYVQYVVVPSLWCRSTAAACAIHDDISVVMLFFELFWPLPYRLRFKSNRELSGDSAVHDASADKISPFPGKKVLHTDTYWFLTLIPSTPMQRKIRRPPLLHTCIFATRPMHMALHCKSSGSGMRLR